MLQCTVYGFAAECVDLPPGALGDFVLTWPLAMAMGRMFPQSRVVYVAAGEKGRLAERAIRVESVDVEAGWHKLFGESPDLPEAAKKWLGGAHTIYNFVAPAEDVWSRNVAILSAGARVIPMSTRASPGAGHVSQWLIDDLKHFPAEAEAIRQMLRSIADRGLGCHRPVNRAAALHPGSGSPKKNWPIARWIDLADALKSAGWSPRWILGEAELEKLPADDIQRLESTANVILPKSYVELFDELCRAACFVGHDSGPGHLAAMIGVPTVSLFGPTDPALWKPLGPRTAVVRSEPMELIGVAEILQELTKN